MQNTGMTRLDGSTVTIDAGAVEALASGLRGRVLDPAAADYDAARTIWNAMIDRRPGLIVRAAAASPMSSGRCASPAITGCWWPCAAAATTSAAARCAMAGW